MHVGISPILIRVCERTHSLETLRLDEIHQFIEIIGSFPRMPDHKCRSDMYARHFRPYLRQQIQGFRLGYMSPHLNEHVVAYVLKRDIQIFANILSLTHHFQQFIGKTCWIRIVQTQPFHTVHVAQSSYELRQLILAVLILAVIRQVLRYNLKLLYTLRHKKFHFIDDFLHVSRLIPPCY